MVRGNAIQVETGLPYRDGQVVSVSVEPVAAVKGCGSPQDLLAAMHAEPHLRPEDVDELELLAESHLPIRESGAFDQPG